VSAEISRLRRQWRTLIPTASSGLALEQVLGDDAVQQLDLFDRLQLQAVLDVCRQSKNMSDAGRKLFAVSRESKAKPNDADRLRKYLARFNLDWERITE
jgi:transcriptional regulatory protein RtcR